MLRSTWPLSYMGGTRSPYWSNVVLLCGFEGADGSTAVPDESPAARGNATAGGNAQIDTAQFKFGSSSLLCDGIGDRMSWADSSDWKFGNGDFTIEAWIRFNSLSGFQTIASQWQTISSNQGWLFDFPGSANNVLRFAHSTTGADTVATQGSWTPSTGTWYHVAASRSGNTLRTFADGVQIATRDMTGVTIHAPIASFRIGTINSAGAEANGFNGWIDELRITKGVGRYTGAFTPPTAAFPRS